MIAGEQPKASAQDYRNYTNDELERWMWSRNVYEGSGYYEAITRSDYYATNGASGMFTTIDRAMLLAAGFDKEKVKQVEEEETASFETIWVLQDWDYYLVRRGLQICRQTIEATYIPCSADVMVNYYLPMFLDLGLVAEIGNSKCYYPTAYAYENFINFANYHDSGAYAAAIADGTLPEHDTSKGLAKGRDWSKTFKKEAAKLKKIREAHYDSTAERIASLADALPKGIVDTKALQKILFGEVQDIARRRGEEVPENPYA